jgi:hypothetical protein
VHPTTPFSQTTARAASAFLRNGDAELMRR